jgi:hypothetical protein
MEPVSIAARTPEALSSRHGPATLPGGASAAAAAAAATTHPVTICSAVTVQVSSTHTSSAQQKSAANRRNMAASFPAGGRLTGRPRTRFAHPPGHGNMRAGGIGAAALTCECDRAEVPCQVPT